MFKSWYDRPKPLPAGGISPGLLSSSPFSLLLCSAFSAYINGLNLPMVSQLLMMMSQFAIPFL